MIALKNNMGSEFVERVRGFFSENGPLSKAKNFEFRPQQQEMAARIAQALEEEQHLVVEAGTGVGKSLAYLMPSVLFALERHKKAIVSTHTINLQEQLLHKDIPILKKVLPVEFEAALMKGRQNYLCPRRLDRALQIAQELFTGPSKANCSDWPSGRAQPAMDRSVICRSNPIQKFGCKFAAKRTSAPKRPAARIRAVSISRRANACWLRT